MLGTQRRSSATIFSRIKGIENMGSLSDGHYDPALTWAEMNGSERWGDS
jgi:hypothetical protein